MAGGTSPPPAQQRSRRRASRSPSVATDPGSRPPRNRRRGGGQQNQGGGGPIGGLPGVNKVADTATGAVGSVGDAVGGLLGGVAGGGDKPLKLRLDLNLDVAVEIKARVHGDLTISLLYVFFALMAIAGLDSLARSIPSSKAIAAMNVYLCHYGIYGHPKRESNWVPEIEPDWSWHPMNNISIEYIVLRLNKDIIARNEKIFSKFFENHDKVARVEEVERKKVTQE
ncbi:hypothetical protein GG344DRAFT_67618 [Lentinula edodes]|nr:hypothetical protein GG344DRAFT_67618 [Lentinula edodes]